MADKKITDLSSAGTITGSELLECVQSGTNKKVTISVIKDFISTAPLVSFKLHLTEANLLAGGDFDITECQALAAGLAWEVVSASVRLVGATTPYDGNPGINIFSDGAARPHFEDDGVLLAAGADNFQKLQPYDTTSGGQTNIVESAKLIVNIDAASAVGDGEIDVYGTARIIDL